MDREIPTRNSLGASAYFSRICLTVPPKDANTLADSASRWAPAGVNRTDRVVRSNNGTPSRSSSPCTCRVTALCVSPARFPACVKLPQSATIRNRFKAYRSMGYSCVFSIKRFFSFILRTCLLIANFSHVQDSTHTVNQPERRLPGQRSRPVLREYRMHRLHALRRVGS